MKQVIDTIELLSSAHVTGEAVAQVLREAGHCEVEVTRLERDGLVGSSAPDDGLRRIA